MTVNPANSSDAFVPVYQRLATVRRFMMRTGHIVALAHHIIGTPPTRAHVCTHPADAGPAWRASLGIAGHSLLMYASTTGTVAALDLGTGRLAWTLQPPPALGTQPLVQAPPWLRPRGSRSARVHAQRFTPRGSRSARVQAPPQARVQAPPPGPRPDTWVLN